MIPIYVQVLFALLFMCSKTNCEPENTWIDPFKFEVLHQKDDSDNKSIRINDGTSYYKRIINLILSSVVQETSESTYQGKLHIDMSSEDYLFLRKFADVNLQEPLTLQKADQILTNSLTIPKMDLLSSIFLSWTDFFYYIVFNRITWVYLTILFIMVITYKLLNTNYSIGQVIKYLICLAYVIDFLFTWKRLLQELEIKKFAESFKYKEMPVDCKLSEMSGWQFFVSFISNRNNCKEYHKIVLYDVFWDVAPIDVVSHQFGKVISVFGSYIGIGLSKLTSGLMSDLPFLYNILFVPILLIFILAIVWLILSSIVRHKKHIMELYVRERGKIEAKERKELGRQHEVVQTKAITSMKHHPEADKTDKWKRDKEKKIGFAVQGKYKKILQHEKKHKSHAI